MEKANYPTIGKENPLTETVSGKSLVLRHSADVGFEKLDAFSECFNGDTFICGVRTHQQIHRHGKRSKTIDVFANGFIEASVCTAHNKIGGNDAVFVLLHTQRFNRLERTGIRRGEFGRLLCTHDLDVNILVAYNTFDVLDNVVGRRSGHLAEIDGNRRILRQDV